MSDPAGKAQTQGRAATNSASATAASDSTRGKSKNIIASHYQIAQKIGEGSFGIIFKGYDLLRGNEPVAIKFESRKSEAPQLKDEFRAYKVLNAAANAITSKTGSSVVGIPKVFYFGQEGYYNVLIIELLGPSLEDLFEWCGRKFSVSTVCRVAIDMIERVRFLHDNGMIYRDIKPDNFLIGCSGVDNVVYMVDYGMVKQYRDPVSGVHVAYRERKSLSGTARYMSINTHLGREQSRRDDMESLGHVFVYFLRGMLPWQGLKAPTNKLKYEKIGERKQRIPVDELCSGLPWQVAEFIRRVRGLRFDEEPDYDSYVELFKSALDDAGSGGYDWMALNDGKGWSWGKNKKINLNGYGSGVRTPKQSGGHTQSQTQGQIHGHTHSGGQVKNVKPRTVSGSGVNERTGLLQNQYPQQQQQYYGKNDGTHQQAGNVEREGRSCISRIFCCF